LSAVRLSVSGITQKIRVDFRGILGIDKLWTGEEMSKFGKVSVRISASGPAARLYLYLLTYLVK